MCTSTLDCNTRENFTTAPFCIMILGVVLPTFLWSRSSYVFVLRDCLRLTKLDQNWLKLLKIDWCWFKLIKFWWIPTNVSTRRKKQTINIHQIWCCIFGPEGGAKQHLNHTFGKLCLLLVEGSIYTTYFGSLHNFHISHCASRNYTCETICLCMLEG